MANNLGGINRYIANLLKKYLELLDANFSNGISGVFEKETLGSLQKDISHSLKKFKERIVVIIDDIDRLSSEEILEVFRIIRGSANFSNIVFVSCFDKNYVEEAIRGSSDALKKTFIEKFFQLEFSLPPYDKNSLRDKATSFADEWLKYHPKDLMAFKSYLEPDKSIVGSHDIMDYFENPRQLLRWLNNISMSYEALKGECHVGDLADIELLKLLYPSIYHLICVDFDKYFVVERGKLSLWNSKTSKKEYDWLPDFHNDIYESEAYNKLESLRDKEFVKKILDRLTKSYAYDIEQLRFSSAGFSQRYFFGILHKDEVSQKEFNDLLNLNSKELIEEIEKRYLNRIGSLLLLCHTVPPKTSEQEEKIIRIILYLASKRGTFAFSTITFMERLERVNNNPEDRESILFDLLKQSPLSYWVSLLFCRSNRYSFPIEIKRNSRTFLSEEFMDEVQLLCLTKALESGFSYGDIREIYSNCCHNFKSVENNDTFPAKIKCDDMLRKYFIEHFSELLPYLYFKDNRPYDDDELRYGITFPFNVLWKSWADFKSDAKQVISEFQNPDKINELGFLYDKCKNDVSSIPYRLTALDNKD